MLKEETFGGASVTILHKQGRYPGASSK